MNTPSSRRRGTLAVTLCTLLVTGLMSACSDGVDPDSAASLARADAPGASTPQPAAGADRTPSGVAFTPLMDDHGNVQPVHPAAVPADPAARTQQQRYATREQARALDDALQGDVIWVQVDCCDAAGIDLAVLTAYGLQAAKDLPSTAPVLVQGANLHQAAAAANRLADQGMSRVFLVTN